MSVSTPDRSTLSSRLLALPRRLLVAVVEAPEAISERLALNFAIMASTTSPPLPDSWVSVVSECSMVLAKLCCSARSPPSPSHT